MMIKVNWVNPWEDAIPVPIEELAECHAGLGLVYLKYDPSGGKRFVMTKDWVLDHWKSAGDKLDAYILPDSYGFHYIGIRYGNEGFKYLSFPGYKDKVQALLEKYTFENKDQCMLNGPCYLGDCFNPRHQ